MSDASQGNAGVTRAISILNEFYDNALVQTGAKFVPADADASGATVGDLVQDTGFDSVNRGNQDAASGIMGMLEVIKSDCERTIDTVQSEVIEAEEAFQSYKDDTTCDIDEKEGLVSTKEGKKSETQGILAD